LGKALAAGVGFEAAGVVKVLVILALVFEGRMVFVHQGVNRIFEGVVFHHHGRGFYAFFGAQAKYSGLPGSCFQSSNVHQYSAKRQAFLLQVNRVVPTSFVIHVA